MLRPFLNPAHLRRPPYRRPFCTSILGHSIGNHAPGRTSDRTKSVEGDSSAEPWIVGHSLLIAHASAVEIYRRDFASKAPGGKGEIGISLNGDWCEPWDDTEESECILGRLLPSSAADALPARLGAQVKPLPNALKSFGSRGSPTLSISLATILRACASSSGIASLSSLRKRAPSCADRATSTA